MIDAFPFANPYKGRVASKSCSEVSPFADRDTCAVPGSVALFEPPADEDSVMGSPGASQVHAALAVLYTRWTSGAACVAPTCPPGPSDTVKDRLAWFKSALEELEASLPVGVESVAFPWHIGCNDSTDAWELFHQEIKWFARRNAQLQVFVVQSGKDSITDLEGKVEKKRASVHARTARARAMAAQERDPFEQVLAHALVDELEGAAAGRDDAPKLAASILYASCTARGISPSTAPEAAPLGVEEEKDTGSASAFAGASQNTESEQGVPTLGSVARANLARVATAGVKTDSALGSLGAGRLETEVAAMVEQAEAARGVVRTERQRVDDLYREHCRQRYRREGLPGNVAKSYSAEALLTPKGLRQYRSGIRSRASAVHLSTASAFLASDGREGSQSAGGDALRGPPSGLRSEGIDVGSHLGSHLPTRLLNLKLKREDGKTVPVSANIADSGAMTVILGLSDYEYMERELPGAVTKLTHALPTSFSGVQGIAGCTPALFHVSFVLDFDGVPVRVADAPVLAGHSGLLLGVDVFGAGRASLDYWKGDTFKAEDGTSLPCDGFMGLKDASRKVVASLPLAHRQETVAALSTGGSSATAYSAAGATDDIIEQAVASAVPLAYAPEHHRIPAWSEHIMKVRAPAAAVGDYDIALLPLEDDRLRDLGILVAPCVQRPDKDGYLWIRVINPSMQPVHVAALTPLWW